jgi:hypothetical protein
MANLFVGYYAGANRDSPRDAGAQRNRRHLCGFPSRFPQSSGSNNTAVGYLAGYRNETGTYNVSVGADAAFGVFGISTSYNTVVGDDAGANNTASNIAFFGYQAGLNNTGGGNSFVGYQSGIANTGGNNNTSSAPNPATATPPAPPTLSWGRAQARTTLRPTATHLPVRAPARTTPRAMTIPSTATEPAMPTPPGRSIPSPGEAAGSC